jgi:hypothetical protein
LSTLDEGLTKLYPVYRLYSDTSRSFITGVYPLNDGTDKYAPFRELDHNGYLLLPVPSRLYLKLEEDGTGNGIKGRRIGVKGEFARQLTELIDFRPL